MRWWSRRSQRDFDEEIRSHIEIEADRLVAEGMSPDMAFDAARRRFGNVTKAQERFHDSGRVMWLDTLARDLRYSWRQLRRSPLSTAVIVVTLALGIGANAVIFGVVDRLLVRAPAHVTDPARLTRIYFRTTDPDGTVAHSPVTTFPMIRALQDEMTTLEDVAGVSTNGWAYTLGSGPEAVEAAVSLVTANYFDLLGVRPRRGRFFAPDEDNPPLGSAVAVLSDGFWRRQFASDPGIIGREVRLDNRPFTVVGIAPRGFTGIDLDNVDVWLPVSALSGAAQEGGWATHAGWFWVRAIARMTPGATSDAVGTEATVSYRRAAAARERVWSDSLATVVSGPIVTALGPEERSSEAKVSVWLAGVSVIVLLIACANVANLLLGRALRRRREIAVRLAMGVGRGRLVRQLLTETMLLALLGATAALLLAWLGGQFVRSVLLPAVAWDSNPVDIRVLGYTALLTIATVLLAGLIPAIQASNTDVATALKAGSREGGGRRAGIRAALLVTQAALSVVLLVGAGLFVRSLHRVRAVDVGIDLSHVLLVQMNLDNAGFKPAESRVILEKAAERARLIPGVEHAALIGGSVPLRSGSGVPLRIPGRAELPALPNGGPYRGVVGADYFAALGARIVRGRGITERDERLHARVVVVNETLARYYWPNDDPLGACVRLGADSACSEVIGIVQDVMLFRMVGDIRGQMYVPLTHPAMTAQAPTTLIVRADGGMEAVAGTLRRELQALSPDMPFVKVSSFEQLVAPQLQGWRLGATMFAVFGGLALVIAAVGLYSVLAYAVSQRVPEIGVRMALGATRPDIVKLFMRDGLGVSVAGVLIGIALALIAGSRIEALLYQTSTRDPVVLGAVIVVLLLVAGLASVAPALRAARVDPSVALRNE